MSISGMQLGKTKTKTKKKGNKDRKIQETAGDRMWGTDSSGGVESNTGPPQQSVIGELW